jgi:gamma-glutamyltranspeptidase / glutathione hydrolase
MSNCASIESSVAKTRDPHPYGFQSRRSPIVSMNGAVASSQPLATEVGIRILHAGGNAADACVAIAAALNVTEPCSTGIGGDCFCLYYNAKTKVVSGLNASGRAPAALTLTKALQDLKVETDAEKDSVTSGNGSEIESSQPDGLPARHVHTITVPGAAAGWVDTIETWGKLSLAQVLEPAITMAEKGVPIAPVTAIQWARSVDSLHSINKLHTDAKCPFVSNIGSDSAGSAHEQTAIVGPVAGEIFKNPELANTFRKLAQHGKSGFYQGAVAEAIVTCIERLGGCMSMSDLKSHDNTFPEPIHVEHEGVNVWEIPPNGQGITALLGLNVLEAAVEQSGEKLAEMKHNSAKYLHFLFESMRIAFADTRWYVADPDVVHVPIKELLSKEYAAKRAAKYFNVGKASVDVRHGSPVNSSSTVSFCVVDQDGNACSFINSNYMGFGSGVVPDGCGFTLQNRGANFSLQPDHPNCLAPGKRPYHTIIPGLATYADDGSLFGPFSVMGGFMQPQGHVQVMCNMLHFGMDPQTALDAPRFCIEDGTQSGMIGIEDGIPDSVLEELSSMGHRVKRVSGFSRSLFGRGQIIRQDRRNGVLWSGSDPRADGCASGF